MPFPHKVVPIFEAVVISIMAAQSTALVIMSICLYDCACCHFASATSPDNVRHIKTASDDTNRSLTIFSKHQLNPNSTQPNMTKVWGDMKITMHPHHPPTHTNSMSAKSHLLLTRFQPNFKGRVLGSTTTMPIKT